MHPLSTPSKLVLDKTILHWYFQLTKSQTISAQDIVPIKSVAPENLDEDVRLVKHSFWRWPTGRFSNLIHQAAALVDLVRHARPHSMKSFAPQAFSTT